MGIEVLQDTGVPSLNLGGGQLLYLNEDGQLVFDNTGVPSLVVGGQPVYLDGNDRQVLENTGIPAIQTVASGGQLVYLDDDGLMHFVDRIKNVIRRSGENISAVEVEEVIREHPAVQAIGVTAVTDEIRPSLISDEVERAACSAGAIIDRDVSTMTASFAGPG